MECLQWCFGKPRRELPRQLASLSLRSDDVSCLETPPLFRRFKSSFKIDLEISPSGEESLVNKKVAAFEQSRVRWNEIASDQLDNVAGNQLVDRN